VASIVHVCEISSNVTKGKTQLFSLQSSAVRENHADDRPARLQTNIWGFSLCKVGASLGKEVDMEAMLPGLK
jgi:hypothetical protein